MENHGILKLALIAAVLALLSIEPARSSEPAYNGKALSEWLYGLNGHLAGDETREQKRERDENAIRQIGTNGIPTLLSILSVTEKNKRKVLSTIQSKALKREFQDKDAELAALRDVAVEGFAILGTNAEPAIAQLTKLLRQNDESLHAVLRALNRVGPKGFSVLTNALNDPGHDPDGAIHNNVLWVLGQEGSGDPKVITQLLIKALKDPDVSNRGNAAQFLAGRDPEIVVPALIPLLDDDAYAAVAAAITLGGYGFAAKSAAPKLLSVYTNSPNPFVFGALKAIDVDSAAKAEDFLVNGPVGVAGFGHTVTRFSNGKQLIAGGTVQTTIPNTNNHVFSRTQIYDPTTGQRTQTGSMNVARYGHAAVLLTNGKVLVAGGSNLVAPGRGGDLTSAELYNPSTGRWAETGSLNAPHSGTRAVLNSRGKVVYGGELYDPATEKWTVVPKK